MAMFTDDLMRKHQKMEHNTSGIYLRQFIFGVEDGLIGGLGLITGVSVAAVSPSIILLSGVALMLTQAVSMGAGTYLSIKSQGEYYERVLEQEKREMEEVPEIETEEVREIYRKHGFQGNALKDIVKKITSNKKTWLSVMMAEEFGFTKKTVENPLIATLVMSLSVILGVFVPLIPHFFLTSTPALTASIIATIAGLFVFGTAKSIYTKRSWLKSGLEMMAVGGLAALAGYLIGNLFAV